MDLLSHLKQPTATKPAPAQTDFNTQQPQPQPAPAASNPTIELEPAPAQQQTVNPAQTPEMMEKAFVESGKALAAMTDQIQSGFFIFLSNKKLGSKLTEAEKKVLIEAENGVQSAEFQSVNEKFEKYIAKHEKLKSKIPFNPEERIQIEDAYTHYCRITGKAMPPELIIVLNGVSVISKRAIDVLTF